MYKYNYTITLSKNQVLCINKIGACCYSAVSSIRFCPHLSSALSRILTHSLHRNQWLRLIYTTKCLQNVLARLI